MLLSDVVRILEATVLTGEDRLNIEIRKGGASDLMSDILAGLSEGSILLTGLTTLQVVRTAIVADLGAVVLVRGKVPDPEVIDQAKAGGIPLLSSHYSMFVASGRLYVHGLTGLDGTR